MALGGRPRSQGSKANEGIMKRRVRKYIAKTLRKAARKIEKRKIGRATELLRQVYGDIIFHA